MRSIVFGFYEESYNLGINSDQGVGQMDTCLDLNPFCLIYNEKTNFWFVNFIFLLRHRHLQVLNFSIISYLVARSVKSQEPSAVEELQALMLSVGETSGGGKENLEKVQDGQKTCKVESSMEVDVQKDKSSVSVPNLEMVEEPEEVGGVLDYSCFFVIRIVYFSWQLIVFINA